MQNRLNYFLMGIGAAYFVRALIKRKNAALANRRQHLGKHESNVVDLMAWRRNMAN